MSRTITAMFDSRSEADAALDRLSASNVDVERARVIDQSTDDSSATSSQSGQSGQQEGFWGSLKDIFMPDEDRHAYGEGIRRGHFMLVAEVDEDQADEACRMLDQDGTVDFDKRQDEWRQQGWSGQQPGAQAGAFGRSSGQERQVEHMGDADSETRIPIAEEQLRVGKREVERGGARVRSYVRETPVHEEVRLREEHVNIERRPVTGSMQAGDMDRGDMFQDREIELTERAEEAVVDKQAVVKEELVIRKTADERVEQIDDSVRRTEVDVDGDGSAFGFDRDRDRTDR